MKTFQAIIIVFVFGMASFGSAKASSSATETYSRLIEIGKQAQSAKRTELAANAFAKATQLLPSAPHAHVLLAQTFAQAGQVRRAEAYLSSLLKRPDQRANGPLYRNAISELQSARPLVLSGSFVLKPSSNVNNVSSESYFDTRLGRLNINGGGKEEFGVGIELGGQASYRVPLGNGRTVQMNAAIYRGFYEQETLRYWRGRIGADLKQIGPDLDWSLGVFAERKTYSAVDQSSGELSKFGVRGSMSKSLGEQQMLHLNALVENRHYLNADTLSGPYVLARATLKTAYANGWSKHVGVSLERRKTELDYHRYWGVGLRAGVEKKVTQNLRLGVNAGLTLRDYDEDFASVDYARQDRIIKFGVSASHQKLTLCGVDTQTELQS